MPKINYTPNQKINNILFLKEAKTHVLPCKQKVRMGLFLCKCGEEFTAVINHVKRGNSTSCGCYQKECSSKRGKERAKHSLSAHPLYAVWANLKQRCYSTKSTGYKHWGGRGIGVCDGWKNDFKAFYDFAMANGYKKGLQIDRKDNDGNYEPSNCRFVTSAINNQNRRNTKLNWDTVNEIRNAKLLIPSLTITEIAEAYSVEYHVIQHALNNTSWAQ